ncbi:pyridoxal-phosphate dependent enzyme [Corynebacterium tuberculostearicum]|uniref:pyridoxal-phosphate dependent enzyme n=1 Tax=Corynebacterium tuberculostearicum TaxID=38304 RepID=UPI0015CD0EF4|nr:pyridoxal-phosphate dependent enzyme [Corynebacterium tuberculostearicum]QQU80986.1 pyridoxal-phosphate dependent enzyme [Corynebacterium tuberculostearicum]
MGPMMSPRIHSQAHPPIGNTPLMRVEAISPRPDVHLYLKLEQFNLGGSAKDRTARALIQAALAAGDIRPGSTLVESSSGNLGMALARQAPLQGMKFHCVVDPRVNASTVATMRAYGAHVELLDHPDPETGDWLTARRTRVAELLEEIPDSFNLNQYSNEAAFHAHAEGTMTEILDQLGQAPSHLLVAMSTTGTLGGCVRKLTELGADTHTIGVDAEGSVLFGGERGTRMLPGYGAGIVTELSTKFSPSSVERVPDLDAIVAARQLAQAEGLLPGASGGAVIAAFQRLAPSLPAGAEVVAVLHDGGQPYLDTIYNDSWVCENFDISPAELAARIEGSAQ